MCWLLIRAFSDDKPAAWRLGDIVEVRSDEFVAKRGWGKLECLPRFYRIQIQDLDSIKVKDVLESKEETDDLFVPGRKHLIRIRNIKVDVDALPLAVKSILISSGIMSLTRDQVKNYVKNNAGTVVSLSG
jgi:hypothetical protein